MWTRAATALMLVLVAVDLQVHGAVKKSRASGAEHPQPEEKEKTDSSEGADNTPASEATSSDYRGNLLVIPMDGSHWIDLKAVAQEMGRLGHRVTVVIPEISMTMGPGKHYDTVTFPVPYNMSTIRFLLDSNKNLLQKDESSFYQTMSKRLGQVQRIKDFILSTAESLLFNSSLISHLAQQVSPEETHLASRFSLSLQKKSDKNIKWHCTIKVRITFFVFFFCFVVFFFNTS